MVIFIIIFCVLLTGYVGLAFLNKKGNELEELERRDGNG